MNGILLSPRGTTSCALLAYGVVQATPETLPALRKHPGPPDRLAMPANLLNHADDQTVVALAAVLRAIDDFHLERREFHDWGVVGSPRFAGRQSFNVSLDRFQRQGPLSVSPLVIPFLSLHAVSSLISLALHIHGPAIGVGGGDGEFVQALLMGLALQQHQALRGVWVVATGWNPDPVAGCGAAAEAQSVCQAAALALLPHGAAAHGPRLRLVPTAGHDTALRESPSLPDLMQFLSSASTTNAARTWFCPVPGDCRLELEVGIVGQEVSLRARSA